jgi:hypothetical protein
MIATGERNALHILTNILSARIVLMLGESRWQPNCTTIRRTEETGTSLKIAP